MSLGDFALFPVKVLLSVVCMVFGFAVLFGGERDWRRPLTALFFFALGTLTWVMLFPRRVRLAIGGVLIAGFGVALLYMALLSSNFSLLLPRDCSSFRRPLGCYIDNALHSIGGVSLVRAVWALFGVAAVLVGAQLILAKTRWRS